MIRWIASNVRLSSIAAALSLAAKEDTVKGMTLFVALLAGLLGPALSVAGEWTDRFKIRSIFVSSATNMHFRIHDVPNKPVCTNGFGYVEEADPGAKGMIATALSAYHAGKRIALFVEPTNKYGNGILFCRIMELVIVD